jgi:hypothetical protein
MSSSVTLAEFQLAVTQSRILSNYKYDSGWLAANNQTNNQVPFLHGLEAIPSSFAFLFSPDLDTAYPLLWSWVAQYSGNPVTISMNSNVILFQISSNFPLHGAWDSSTGAWTTWSQGYFRVFASP